MRLYDYLFFKIYKILIPFDDQPRFYVILLLCWLLLFNFVSISMYFDIRLFDVVFSSRLMAIFSTLASLGLHLLYFDTAKTKYIVNEEFNEESNTSSIVGYILSILFILLSIWIFFNYSIDAIEMTWKR